ncbi:probable serine/threonine-protein kinase PBL3 [Durio zibethinus]|uniref:Probable serine/threonine-protein kinase PBL3 n=1 Tax=Durio zibethinus TaxID=66656 RepID=A0A6P6ABY4_DURZI|nr:probable serine/threonine-protein kinase PBL3 [Durio zibethinus]
MKFLQDPSVESHPGMVKLIGHCCQDTTIYGAVYDINPEDTLQNIIDKDSFTWVQRMKVALGLARLLEFLHNRSSPYLVLNIDAAHPLLDQDFNPMLIDFGLLKGGIIGEYKKADTHGLHKFCLFPCHTGLMISIYEVFA